MTSTQHRCVFVGNIPYDATEEQLVQICEEVGPVVSFRLVLDRDTGKPKGYGFCEFRDEETALSARRNLQGYEINGRQLRVDFAENDKGSVDRNREQGRGGPGLTSTIDAHKHSSGVLPLTARSSGSISFDRPVGIAVAAAAAAVMAGALGGSQMPLMMGRGNSGSNGQPNGGGRDGRAAAGNDPLTNHLAGMSKHQLYEIVTQMKDLIQQNQQQARQILIANPQLTKALFQAQIMLGMVRPPAVQLPHQNVITQPQSHIQAPQQQNDQQSQMQPLHMQAVQPLHVQTVPQMQTMQKAQVHINQVQQSQIQAVQTTQPPNVQMQPHVQGVQLSQAESIPVQPQLQASQPLQNLSFQHSVQPIQQSHAQTVPMQLSLQSVPQPPPHSMTLQSQIAAIQTQSLSSQHNNLPPQPLQPPLPQQPRPPTAPPQMQPQPAQSMSFQLPSIPQLQPGQQPSFQQPGGMPQTSSSLHFQQQLQPPMLNQAALQPSSQIPHSGADTGGGPNITQGSLSSSMGMLTDGISMGVGAPQVGKGPSTASSNAPTSSLTWNQPPHSIGAMVGFTGVPPTNAPVGMAGQTGSGHSFSGGTPMSGGLTGTVAPPQQDSNGKGFGSTGENIGGGLGGPPEGLGVSGMILSQGYGQVVQPQLQQQSQQQPQMQLSPELEQQKSLLQQVMNLTPEQINSLPPEQRQQVFQLQQAFRN